MCHKTFHHVVHVRTFLFFLVFAAHLYLLLLLFIADSGIQQTVYQVCDQVSDQYNQSYKYSDSHDTGIISRIDGLNHQCTDSGPAEDLLSYYSAAHDKGQVHADGSNNRDQSISETVLSLVANV